MKANPPPLALDVLDQREGLPAKLLALCREVFHANAPTPGQFDLRKPIGFEIRERQDAHMTSRRLLIYARGAMCAWNQKAGGCTYCGFYQATNGGHAPTHDDFIAQIDSAFEVYEKNDADAVGFYNDGSFLNDDEIERGTQLELLRRLAMWPRIKQITIESRPEYMSSEKLNLISRAVGSCKLEIATGIDSLNERILKSTTNRGMNPKFTLERLDAARKRGIRPLALMVFKPPFMTEAEAVADAHRTICRLIESEIPVDIEAMTIQRGSAVHLLHSRGHYRTPWLWSIAELLRGLPSLRDVYLSPFSYSVATDEVPHNCEKCTAIVARQLLDVANASRDKGDLPEPRPCCFERWHRQFWNSSSETLEQRAARILHLLRDDGVAKRG
jgi:radical SAM enzyme (TIGR01210 family)